MKTNQRRVLGWLWPVLFLVVILWAIGSVEAQTIGKTIDKSNYKEYAALLNPAMLAAVQRGEWILPTANLGFPYRHWDHFLAASEKNEGKFDINAKGDLINKGTGKFPKHNVYGMPFSTIDPKDPKVAEKIMWNFKFTVYRQMARNAISNMIFLGQGGAEAERTAEGLDCYLYYQGRLPGQAMPKNPQNFLYNELDVLISPMGMRGMVQMTWEYADERQDTCFAYIPSIRRTRQMSGAARSDAAWGSDGFRDLGYGFAGKNTTFKFKFAGERMVLVPFTKLTKDVAPEAPDGTITNPIPPMTWGYQTKGWTGAPWAITNATFVPRSVWIVEGMPLDPYYNYGKMIFYVDKETYTIWYDEIFDRAGLYWKTQNLFFHYSEAPSGKNTVGVMDSYQQVDDRVHHSTIYPKLNRPGAGYLYMPASRIDSNWFSISHMIELSK